MSFASEFREFAVKGSVVDLAVGVIIGAAFGKIVDWKIFVTAVEQVIRIRTGESGEAAV
jgi:large conductance mechanosensitive channel protein